MFPVTLTIHNANDLNVVMSALHFTQAAPAPSVPDTLVVKQEKPKAPKPAPAPAAASNSTPADAPASVPGTADAGNAVAAATTPEAPAAPTVSADVPVTYAAARELVLKLAATNREAIKAINTKHGIAKLSSLLKDENDFDSVIDQAKLNAVHGDLVTLAA